MLWNKGCVEHGTWEKYVGQKEDEKRVEVSYVFTQVAEWVVELIHDIQIAGDRHGYICPESNT